MGFPVFITVFHFDIEKATEAMVTALYNISTSYAHLVRLPLDNRSTGLCAIHAAFVYRINGEVFLFGGFSSEINHISLLPSEEDDRTKGFDHYTDIQKKTSPFDIV